MTKKQKTYAAAKARKGSAKAFKRDFRAHPLKQKSYRAWQKAKPKWETRGGKTRHTMPVYYSKHTQTKYTKTKVFTNQKGAYRK